MYTQMRTFISPAARFFRCHLTFSSKHVCMKRSPAVIAKCYATKKFTITHKRLTPFEVPVNDEDVLLFKYENSRHYLMLTLFGISQLLYWGSLSSLFFTPVNENRNDLKGELQTLRRAQVHVFKVWNWIQSCDQKYRNVMGFSCIVAGYGICFAITMFLFRSVRYLKLLKGGKNISVVTYSPIGKHFIDNVPLTDVSCMQSVLSKKHISLRIKNKRFFFRLNKDGTFLEPELFQYTAGLKRF